MHYLNGGASETTNHTETAMFEFQGFTFEVDNSTSIAWWDGEGEVEPSNEILELARHHWWYELEPQPEADNYDDKWYDLKAGE